MATRSRTAPRPPSTRSTRSGGILGEKVVLKYADDAGEPKQGVSAANQLVGDGIRFVVGPVTSGVAMAASDVFAENGVLMVTPTATAPDLTKRGLTNVLRTCGRDDQQAEVAANYVLKNFKDKRVAIINDKGAYGKGLADSLQGNAQRRRHQGSARRRGQPRRQGFQRADTRLKAEKVDVSISAATIRKAACSPASCG
jgi:branched-chain amino acid transport system substrate-binding protein